VRGRAAWDWFQGEWKYLHRALIEPGLYIRVIDDDEQFSKQFGDLAFGELVGLDGSRGPLKVREVANKIIHCERYEWKFAGDPRIRFDRPSPRKKDDSAPQNIR
jgi:hypothetical protein